MLVDVEYCHVPCKCLKCNVFGHDCSNPGGRTKQIWVVKQPRVLEVPQDSRDKGKSVALEEATESVSANAIAEVSAQATIDGVDAQSSQSPAGSVEGVIAMNEDGFQVVTNRKNRVRAPAPGSIKSPWNYTGSSSGKLSVDEVSFPSLNRVSPKQVVALPAPVKGRGRGRKRGK
ncbi:unnamed protein product [Linum trigynum]